MLRRVAVLLALIVPFTLLPVAAAHAGTESEFTSRINGERSARGLRGYAVRSDLAGVARRHAARMAASGRIYHNPNLGGQVTGWRSVGENVGRGGSVSVIHRAFMGSSSHRSNILSTTFTEVGVGTARSGDGTIYVSQVFRRPASTSSYTPSSPPPRPAVRQPAPRPTYRTYVRPRASRTGVRAPLPQARRAAPKRVRVPVDPTPARLRAAWAAYRDDRPHASLERAVAFVRVNRMVAG
ncbi:MAG TPA: CAP domain-containing protein [Frankiaceae bacterium]|nr:CAP domain-containing protein [Frankiaceae bacterium]